MVYLATLNSGLPILLFLAKYAWCDMYIRFISPIDI